MMYIAQVDYGPEENSKRPRWFVFEQYFIWAGNHGTRRLDGPFWTSEEAREAMENRQKDYSSLVMRILLGLAMAAALLWAVKLMVT